MGKKTWLSAVKKALIKRSRKSNSKKSRHGNQMMSLDTYLPQTDEAALANPPMVIMEEPDLKQPQINYQPELIADGATAMLVDLKQPDDEEIMQPDSIAHDTAMAEEPVDLKQPDNEESKQPDSIAHDTDTAMAEEPAAPPADAEVMIPATSTTTQFSGKSKEEIAATKIQTIYRGHVARKDWRTLRARRRLRVMIKGQAVKRQTASTLLCMQTLARVQSQVRSRRIRMAEVNRDLQRQLLQKTKKDLDRVKSSEKIPWDLSPKSKEQVEASLRKKRETAERRERALAYIHTHQQIWRNSLKSTSTEPWGWSWLDRWNAVRPWEPTTTNTESVEEMGKCVSTRSPSKASLLVLRSASSKGSVYSMQSIKGSPNESLRSSSVAHVSKGPTKSATNAPNRLVSGKKAGSGSRLGVGSTKKQISLSGPSSGSRRSSRPRKTTSKTVR